MSAGMQNFVVTPSKNTPDKLLLSQWSLPQEVLEMYSERGITSMFEWQFQCLSLPGVLTGTNLIIGAPTGAGKTLVAELIALKCVLERKKKVLIIVPFVSVAREKAAFLQSIFEPQITVDSFVGNQSLVDGFNAVDIAICTIEKANKLVTNLLEREAIKVLGVVIVDELHMIGNRHRGYLLELLLTKVLYIERVKKGLLKIQLVGMSPTFPNMNSLARWLQAQIYYTEVRPTPLKEIVKIGSTLYNTEFEIIRELDHSEAIPDDDYILLICKEHVLKRQSVLIFCPTKECCESLALTLAKGQKWFLQSNLVEDRQLIDQLQNTQVGLDRVLEETVPKGIAFHHAGLTLEEREIIEKAFVHTQVNVLVATTTLSYGVNLPAQLVIVRTPYFHGTLIDLFEYKQMIGRAGRKGLNDDGESILMCKDRDKSKVKRLFRSAPKPIQSCLCMSKETQFMNDSTGKLFALKRALLEVIASGVADTKQDIMLYSSCTLFHTELQVDAEKKSQKDSKEDYAVTSLQEPVSVTLNFLLNNGFISSDQEDKGIASEQELTATPLGLATVASSLSPEEALVFKELKEASMKYDLENELYIIYMMVIPGYMQDRWPRIDWYRYHCNWTGLPENIKQMSDTLGVRESFLVQPIERNRQRQTLPLYRRFFMAMALHELIHEVPITQVAERYRASKGLLQTLQSAVETFAGMMTVFCRRIGWRDLEDQLSQFQNGLGTDPKQTRKRPREFSYSQGATVTDCTETSSLCEKQTHNNKTDHSVKPSSSPDVMPVPAYTPCSKKKAKLSPEEMAAQRHFIEDSMDPSPISVQTGEQISEQTCRELSGENMATAEGATLDQRVLSGSGTATPTIDSMPTLKQLKLMEIGSEKIKITEITCNAWKNIGELLDFDDFGSKVSSIKTETCVLEDRVIEVLLLWMKGESRDYNPATWRTFIKLLRESGHQALANKIDDHFK